MLRTTTTLLCSFALLSGVAACGGGEPDDGADDHALHVLTFEGQELADLFGADGTTEAIHIDGGFRRLGLLWDVAAEDALEVRTSTDGATWSAWTTPTIVSAEDIAHAGHVDAITVGEEGSSPDDPTVPYLMLRIAAGKPAPTFLVVEALADIPPAFDPDETVPEEGGDGGDPLFSDLRSTPIGAVRIYSKADWGGRAPRCATSRMTPNRATIHHTVTPTNDSLSPQARLRQIQSFHMNTNGWCDIGYNYLVSRDGRVWRGRGAVTVGAHVTNNNTGNIGISFIGTYTSTAPTATQMCSAARLLRRLSMDFSGVDLNRTDVKGHRQYGGTACPGNALYNRIDTILSKARNGC